MQSIYAIFLFSSLLLIGCSKPSSINLPNPASIDEISKTVFTINYNDEPHGKGLLVGINDGKVKERIFFLTARHVSTFRSLANSHLNLCFGTNGSTVIKAEAGRWYTAPKEFDMAWFELTSTEKEDFAKKNLLNYIPIHLTAKKGSWAQELHKYAIENSNAVVNVKMFYRDGIMDGKISMKNSGIAPLPFPHNKHLKQSHVLVFLANTPKICDPGDSGGAAFIQCEIEKKVYWLLCGIVVGGNRECQVNAIQPIDEVVKILRFDSRRLIDFPEYW
jgi:hypothetical protein